MRRGDRCAERIPFVPRLTIQGSVLAPILFTLCSAGLVEELRKIHGPQSVYADDSATLCSGATITEDRDRAQRAADVMASWPRRWKMRLAGSKTQVLALSQRYEDVSDLVSKVYGTPVRTSDISACAG